MFDPTAFENMRVVMEGSFYDRDLNGELTIIDRNDWMNTAKLSRTYDLSFQIPSREPLVTCRFSLQADLQNLAAELLPAIQSSKHAGCRVTIEFLFNYSTEKPVLKEVERIIKEIWGDERTIKMTCCSEPLICSEKGNYKAEVLFNRMITEEQMDDLMLMCDYMLLNVRRLEEILR